MMLWALSLFLLAAVFLAGHKEEEPLFGRIADDPSLQMTLDLNQVSAAELESLPGIGPVLAAAVDEFLRREGPVRDLDELRRIRGIGPAKLALIREWVRVGEMPDSVGAVDDEIRGRHEGGVQP